MENLTHDIRVRKPKWLRRRLPAGPAYEGVCRMIASKNLHTVCQEAKCPNVWECFAKHTATFMILGDRCTRNCKFCGVKHGPIGLPDPEEPVRVASGVKELGLKYVTITSVTRDDLEDGGAKLFVSTINEIRKVSPGTRVEVLIPDFQENKEALWKVATARPDVLNHNIETVPRLYVKARPQADYKRSLLVLFLARKIDDRIVTKSGLMLGLGESEEELLQTMKDLLKAGCRILTLGQYLQPSKDQLPVERFVEPEEFEKWRKIGLEMGFAEVASGPFVRSSYNAGEIFESLMEEKYI
ncbi:MAG: lipoyl synthase [Desulfobacteraceae bacterium]|nr:lipoyl synthase [Desulfobacteraceae bacterium]MBC2755828.1 lipoyl synthase [Desulfobacteraceae bacterium]